MSTLMQKVITVYHSERYGMQSIGSYFFKRYLRIISIGLILFFSLRHITFFAQLDTYIMRGSAALFYPIIRMYHAIIGPLERTMQYSARCIYHGQQYQQLHERYEKLLASYATMAQEYTLYRDIAPMVRAKEFASAQEGLLGQIIYKEITPEHHFVLVDVGSYQGIAVDMVAVYNNCLIGRVVHVTPFYSKIMLITDQRVKIGGICVRANVKGMYTGTQQLEHAALMHVSHLHPIEPGDMVMSHGEGLIYPRGFLLGIIKEARKEGVNYAITLSPCVDLNSLTYCTILEKK